MRKAFALLSLLFLFSCTGCASDTQAELSPGFYVYAGSASLEMATFSIEEDQLGTFFYSPLSSTIPSGSYTISDGILTLETDGSHSYVFAVQEDTLVFDAEASSSLPDYAKMPNGAIFLRIEEA